MNKNQNSEDSNLKSVPDSITQLFPDQPPIETNIGNIQEYKSIIRDKDALIIDLRCEIEQLKQQLNALIIQHSSFTPSPIYPLSDEEEIALMQLERLKGIARERQLTLDETRQFDLLVKNKRLAQGSSTLIEGSIKSVNTLSEQSLIQMANKTKLKLPPTTE